MLKFSLGDKVFIKSLKKEGKIVGCFWEQTQTGGINVSYSLAYETDWGYNGKKLVHVRVVEDGLDFMDKYERVAIGPKGLLKITNGDISKEDINNMRVAWDSVVMDSTCSTPHFRTLKSWMTAVNENLNTFIKDNTSDEGHCYDHLDALHYMSYTLEPKGIDSCEIAVDLANIKTCDHQWLPYEGLTQRFEYCKHCDVKKGS